MADLIDRAALLAAGDATKMDVAFEDWNRIDWKTQQHILNFSRAFKRLVEYAPAIDAEPVKHGEWTETVISYHDPFSDEYWDEFFYEHKECGCQNEFKYNYCPNCGAKMDGGKET